MYLSSAVVIDSLRRTKSFRHENSSFVSVIGKLMS
jgi:hypothetical protein